MSVARILPILLFLFVFQLSLVPVSVLAQENAVQSTQQNGNSSGQATAPAIDSETWRGVLDSTAQALGREGLTDADLDKLSREVARVEQEALLEADRLKAERALLRQRIESLGPKPADGEPAESADAEQQRSNLNEQFGAMDARVKVASETSVRARQLREQIGERRHDRFFSSISVRTPAIAEPAFWGKFISGFAGYSRSFYLLITDSFSVFWQEITASVFKLVMVVFMSLLAVLLFVRGQGFTGVLKEKADENGGLAPVEGFIFYLRVGVLPALLLYALYAITASQDLLTSRLDEFLQALVISVGLFFIIASLLRVVFAPYEPSRRLIGISDKASRRIYLLLWSGLLVAIILFILNTLASVFVSPLEVKVGLSFLHALTVGGVGLASLVLFRRDRRRSREAGMVSQATPRFWQLLTLVVWGVTLAILVFALAGYVAFAEFLSQQQVFGLVVVISAWLLLRFVDFGFQYWTAGRTAEISGTDEAVESSASAGQTAILASGVLKLLIYTLAAMLLLLPWGYRTSDFYQLFEGAFFGFEVGGLSVSVSTILLALLLFVVGYTVTVGLKNWLNNKLLPTTSLDIGISNSISTVFGYVGVIVAAMLAVSAAGFDLSNLAIVAGALSVGVGFGLQSIVNNFVSGLILLAERPIKAGDWVSTAGGDGYVRKISVRSTEIETFDRATVIVPNSSLITDTVTNWTHGNTTGRIIIPVGVGYDSDPEQVKEILIACAKEHRMVLGRPAPVVYFMDFGASSLDFQLRCFLSDINWGLSVTSELRFAILKALREANIEIPFPQRDVNLKYAEPDVPPAPKPRTRRSKST